MTVAYSRVTNIKNKTEVIKVGRLCFMVERIKPETFGLIENFKI